MISTDVYRFTRNPMYVSMALIQTAIGIGFSNAWRVALVPPVLAVVYVIAIHHEEACLSATAEAAEDLIGTGLGCGALEA